MQILREIIFGLVTGIIFWQILKGNLALAIISAVILFIDYHMWLRGSNSLFFKDETQIERNLREIQKLETKQKLKELSETKQGD